MAAYMPPGPPRPGAGNSPNQPLHQQQPPQQSQPTYGNPNALADGIQSMNLYRAPPPNYTPRPGPVAQSQQPFSTPPPGSQPMSRPGPPPAGAFPRPSGQGAVPPNVALSRPSGPPVGQPGVGSYRAPPPPGVLPSNMGFPSRAPASAGFPAGPGTAAPPSVGSTLSGARPQMGPVGLTTGPILPPVSTPAGAINNGPPPPPMFGASRFTPPAGGVSQQVPGATPPIMPSLARGPPAMNAPQATPMQAAPPFTMSPHAMSYPPTSPFAAQTWPVASPPIPGAGQPPRFGMPPSSIPNQPLTSISPGMTPTGASGTSKIDPNQIPRPIPGSAEVIHETRLNNQANPPPPATSDYIVRDTGNCSPRFMRCTINQIPCTADLLTTSGMQLALLIQPFALQNPSEEPIQIVDFGESGPVRCSRCKGYINPFMKFIDQGRRFICNLCGFNDVTPRDYHCNLGPDGRRRDADQRAELCRGTVEFVASKEYMIREPMPAVYFFIIDVSMNAIQTGATAAACSAISQVIADLPEGPRTMVGVATFDSTIHFYNLKRALQQPLMLIVPDIQDVYTPLQTDVIVPLSECRQHLELLLENIPTMFQHNSTAESAFGAAVKGAFLAMKSTGGKLLVFQSVLPSVGIGALSAREAEGRTNVSAGEKEVHKLLQPADKTLKTMAIEFAEYQVCVDIFLTSQSYVDVASISVVSRTTGGQVYYYHPFSAISDSGKLYNDLRWNITRPQGFEAVMRVRCSQGIQVQEYHGNFCKRIPTDIDLPGIDCDKTIMVTLKHDDKLQEGTEIAFQCALLYTTVNGERRIRITTLSLPCTSLLTNLFRAADLDAQFTCLLKQAGSEISTIPLSQVQQQATNHCINILLAYRKFCATVSSAGQLILPEALKLLPLYTLALIKSIGLRNEGKIDDRSFWVNYVSSISTPLVIPLVYPRLISIHDLNSKNDGGSSIPPVIPLSSEHISDDGIYLLENGEDALIYVGGSVNPETLSKLFGVSAIEEIHSQFVLQQFDNPASKRLNEVVNEIRRQRCSYLRLRLCKKGDQSGMLFYSYLVEDKNHGGLSYVEFLVYIHRQIQMKMS
ncbi:hypothetical protein MLD38_018143 [Melastoma candidum]|uniref:Uncharacterized protein n=1 Tax=Melastoma candidum TaxID=119954 RepID=A0ACB9QSX6_9MYRT|nr:hypothetical protein MLD38_018143 [Melastoma candidum]